MTTPSTLDGGVLYSLIYGEVSTLSVNPIEKKPVFRRRDRPLVENPPSNG